MVCEAGNSSEKLFIIREEMRGEIRQENRGSIHRWRVAEFRLEIDVRSWRSAGYTIRALFSSGCSLQIQSSVIIISIMSFTVQAFPKASANSQRSSY